MEEKFLSIIKENLKNEANDLVISEISNVILAIDDILRKVDNDRAVEALKCANRAYYIAKGYTEFNSYNLSKKLGISNNKTKNLIRELIKNGKIEKIEGDGVTFLKLKITN